MSTISPQNELQAIELNYCDEGVISVLPEDLKRFEIQELLSNDKL